MHLGRIGPLWETIGLFVLLGRGEGSGGPKGGDEAEIEPRSGIDQLSVHVVTC